MPNPKPQPIVLEANLQHELENLVRRHNTPQQISLRARIILLANQGHNNQKIAQELGICDAMARLWRKRWISEQLIPLTEKTMPQRLADASRSGAPAKISPEAYCQIMALACQPPQEFNRPISQWTSRELADEAIDKGIVKSISPRQVGRFLKRSRS